MAETFVLSPPADLGLLHEGVRRRSLSRSPDRPEKKVQADHQQAQQGVEQ
jgi:hypothetical protein